MPDARGLLTAEERAALEAEYAAVSTELESFREREHRPALNRFHASGGMANPEAVAEFEPIHQRILALHERIGPLAEQRGRDYELRRLCVAEDRVAERPEVRALAEAKAAHCRDGHGPSTDHWTFNLDWAEDMAVRLAAMGYRVVPYRETGR